MPSIDEILSKLGVEENEKTASAENVKQEAKNLGLTENEKTASNNNGGEASMDLQSLYQMHFGQTKVASQVGRSTYEKTAAQRMEKAGEIAGSVFADELESRLIGYAIKVAMSVPDSKASRYAQKGPAVVAGSVGNPQLAVNRPDDADEPIDTDCEHFDLMDAAIAKQRLLKALNKGKAGELSHRVFSLDSGMAMPKSQANA